ncbi:hypothetical protein TSMEX_003216 [Taenia solium]|eukprot:TsM_000354600 transcript=TsM_000354600 gene=TsM_000354600
MASKLSGLQSPDHVCKIRTFPPLCKGQMTEYKETGKTSPPPNFYVSEVGSFFFQLSWNTLSLAESHPLYISFRNYRTTFVGGTGSLGVNRHKCPMRARNV